MSILITTNIIQIPDNEGKLWLRRNIEGSLGFGFTFHSDFIKLRLLVFHGISFSSLKDDSALFLGSFLGRNLLGDSFGSELFNLFAFLENGFGNTINSTISIGTLDNQLFISIQTTACLI